LYWLFRRGFNAWQNAGKQVDCIKSVTVNELADKMAQNNIHIIDVRKKSEYDSEHILEAVNAPLDFMNDSMTKVNKNETAYIHCAGGYRSMIFISILKARGFNNLTDVKGGFKAIKESNQFRITDYVCPSTML
jgi:rhodanese-related sulfurtransferase